MITVDITLVKITNQWNVLGGSLTCQSSRGRIWLLLLIEPFLDGYSGRLQITVQTRGNRTAAWPASSCCAHFEVNRIEVFCFPTNDVTTIISYVNATTDSAGLTLLTMDGTRAGAHDNGVAHLSLDAFTHFVAGMG